MLVGQRDTQLRGALLAACEAWQQALTILDDLNHPDAAHVHAKLAGLGPPTDHRG